jgi:hypothetical protein
VSKVLNKKHHAMLQALLDLGTNIELIAVLLDLCDLSQDHLRYMAGPLVVHKSLWSETLPTWVRKAVYKDRLEQILTETENGVTGDLATPTEVMAYMYAASLDAPLSHEWTNIYLWCSNYALTKHKRFSEGQTYWDRIGVEPITLSDYERKEYLNQLQRDIRRTVVNKAAQNGWNKNRLGQGSPVNGNGRQKDRLGLKAGGNKVVQVSLFDWQ